ncbi:MAG: TonB-dependent receptor plug domain-containing protein [Candidatus Synoicihabitans palmerolidicus]|nr:TonB-dependent receptor plug domain-containing protein [Candidatus Synoicihabitans palmerolidicus]
MINRGLLQGGENTPLYHDIVTRAEIERMGVSSLEELFRYLPQTSSVSTVLQAPVTNPNETGGQAPTYSTVGLRGFSSAQTVVLVNGRSLPLTGLRNGGGADLSRIPLAAIERVEILPSSGSAIYGGGALDGAINIILRKEYSGRDLTSYIGTSTEGGATEYRWTYLEGMRFNEGRSSLTTTLSYHHRDALRSGDRDYLDEALARYGPDSTLANAQNQTYFEQYILRTFAAAPGTILVGSGASDWKSPVPMESDLRPSPLGTTAEQSLQLTSDSFAATAGQANLTPRYACSIIYEPIDAYSLNAILEHEFVPDQLDGYLEFTLGRNERSYSMPQSLSIDLSADDPLNPFRTNVTPGFVGRPIYIYLDASDLPDASVKSQYDSARLVAGLKGQAERMLGVVSRWHHRLFG